jgi:ActR/RegA family two-component response regulator
MALQDRGSVLVVDDEENVMATLQGILAQAGYEAVGTTTCAEALHRVREQTFDVVLSDVRLEDGDGMTIVEEVHRRSPSTATILLTGYASLDSAIGALRHGVSDYLLKPCDIDELQRTVARGVEHRQTMRLLEERHAELAAANAGLVAMSADLQRRVESLIAEAQARSQMLRAVAEAGRALAAASSVEERSLDEAMRLVVPAVADYGSLHGLATQPGGQRQLVPLATVHIDTERGQDVREAQARYPTDLAGDAELAVVVRTGEPVLLDGIDDLFLATRIRSGQRSDLIAVLRPRSALFVPLLAPGRTLGVLVLAQATVERRFGLDELALAEHLAARVALALDGSGVLSRRRR